MDNIDELYHYGVLGMRWGTRSGQRKTDKLSRNVDYSMRKYDRGDRGVDSNTFKDLSRKTRKQTYKTNRRIERMNAYLNRVKSENVNNMIIKFNHNPEKVANVKEYLHNSQLQTKKLSEIRTSLMDIKLDLL